MKRVLYVGNNANIRTRLKSDWEIGTQLKSADIGLHAVIQDAVLSDCDVVVFESPSVLNEFQMYPEATWARIKQYASNYMEATGWVVELFCENELGQKHIG